MNKDSLRPCLYAALLALASACSTAALLRPEPQPGFTGGRPSEQETWYLEGDLGRDAADRALALTAGGVTLARALTAYRQSPATGSPPETGLAPVHYGKVFGDTAVSDTYYLLARPTARDGTPTGRKPHLWTRTGLSPWHYSGVHEDPARIPHALREAWTSRDRTAAASCGSSCCGGPGR